jgi:GT2 family glycosyltransferase
VDNTVKIVEKNPRVKVVANPKRKGAAYSRNRGIINATGSYILFIDSDVFLDKNCLKEMLRYANDFHIVQPAIFFENGSPLSVRKENEYPKISPAFLIKKEALKELDELFDETYFIYGEDFDFFLRCYLSGLTAKYADSALAFHIAQPASYMENKYFLETRNYLYALIKFSFLSPSIRSKFGFPLFHRLVILFFMGLFNRRPPERPFIKGIPVLFSQESRIAKHHSKLLYSLHRALIWNLLHLKKSLEKRALVKTFYERRSPVT